MLDNRNAVYTSMCQSGAQLAQAQSHTVIMLEEGCWGRETVAVLVHNQGHGYYLQLFLIEWLQFRSLNGVTSAC